MNERVLSFFKIAQRYFELSLGATSLLNLCVELGGLKLELSFDRELLKRLAHCGEQLFWVPRFHKITIEQTIVNTADEVIGVGVACEEDV